MRRRDLLILLSAAGCAPPFVAEAQQKTAPVIGFLSSASAEGFATLLPAFRRGLQDAGYREGENVTVE